MCLLGDLTERSLFPRLALVELPFRQRPVGIERPMHEQYAPVADDDSAGSANHIYTSIRSASPWPPPEQIAASPSPPPFRRSSCTIVPRMRPPEAPIGWPSGPAPPFTFPRSSSAPSNCVEWCATDE